VSYRVVGILLHLATLELLAAVPAMVTLVL
jgi:hypothetical protein